MSDVLIRTAGRAGRITLNRPGALNALTAGMAADIEAALDAWRGDDAVALVVIDAAGDKAFCAGGDIADLYAHGRDGDFDFGRRFWADEYRLNAKIAEYPKPVVALMQGFTMGGGVGIGCHASHRVVGETSRIAMPECGIGLVPDVGGSLLLARAPGRLGEYLGLTGARMGPGEAIRAGFADVFLPEKSWPGLIEALERTGDPDEADRAAHPAPEPALPEDEIASIFDTDDIRRLADWLAAADSEFAARALEAVSRNSPLSMAATLMLIARVREVPTIRNALMQEYRFTWRASEEGDFLEGIRAAIIDKDRTPRWKHTLDTVTREDAAAMLAPLGANDLTWKDMPCESDS